MKKVLINGQEVESSVTPIVIFVDTNETTTIAKVLTPEKAYEIKSTGKGKLQMT